jgi:hypothetical protein
LTAPEGPGLLQENLRALVAGLDRLEKEEFTELQVAFRQLRRDLARGRGHAGV